MPADAPTPPERGDDIACGLCGESHFTLECPTWDPEKRERLFTVQGKPATPARVHAHAEKMGDRLDD